MTENNTNLKSQINFPTILYKEGSTSFFIPDLDYYKVEAHEYLPSKLPVFFNPVMEFRRDISILAIHTYKARKNKEITFCDPLAATGALGIRVRNEIKGVTVYINDINKLAVELAKKSISYNNLNNIFVFNDYAESFLIKTAENVQKFNVIDIDPFGPPVQYLDAALMAIKGDGLICCTATDMPPLVGIMQKACIRKYSSVPLKTEYSHELAVRILIGFIVRQAAKYNSGVKILLSHSSNHYIQIFFEILHGILVANQTLTEIGYIGHCFNCENRELYRGFIPNFSNKCSICNNSITYTGPLWLGNLSDIEFCQQILKNISEFTFKNKKRIQKLIELIIQEHDSPTTYFNIHKLGGKQHFIIPPIEKIIKSLETEKFIATRTHFCPTAIKTNANYEKIIQIVRDLLKD